MLKKISFAAVAFCLTAGPVFATPRADEIKSEPAKGSAKVQPTGEHMSEAQKKNLQALATDLQAIQAGSEVTQEQKDALHKSLSIIADGANKPSEESMKALASSLSSAKSDGSIEPAEAVALAADVAKVLESANIPQEEVQAAIVHAQEVLIASGVTKEVAMTVASDLKVVAAEIQATVAVGKSNVEAATGGKAKKRRGR